MSSPSGSNHHQSSSSPTAPPIQRLDTNLLANVLSFCDVSDLLPLLLLSSPRQVDFKAAIRCMFSTQESLSFSFLLKRFPNSARRRDTRSQSALCQLMGLLPQNNNNNNNSTNNNEQNSYNSNKCLRVEFSNLRKITGEFWLTALQSTSRLVGLNLSGCFSLSPDHVRTFLNHCSKTLKELSLFGCVKMDSSVVDAIAAKHSQLESLCLGGCSRRIRTDSVCNLFRNLRSLRIIDLQCLSHLEGDDDDVFLRSLPPSIESINLFVCERLELGSGSFFSGLLQTLQQLYGQQQHNNNNGIGDTDICLADESAMEVVRNVPLLHEAIQQQGEEEEEQNNQQQLRDHHRPTRLLLASMGCLRRGLCHGMLAYFALGECLKEIYLEGCEEVRDWEVEVMARRCRHLSIFDMHETQIGDQALRALATHCRELRECDVSACFQVTDQGILDLCRTRHSYDSNDGDKNTTEDGGVGEGTKNGGRLQPSQGESRKQRVCSSRLRVLRIANLPGLTDAVLSGIANLQSLQILDVHECSTITTTALCDSILHLPHLIDVNARGANEVYEDSSLPVLLREVARTWEPGRSTLPTGLRFVNQRIFVAPLSSSSPSSSSSSGRSSNTVGGRPSSCCTVRSYSQRLSNSVPLSAMIHCLDCGLIPGVDRGVCWTCASTCHKGHRTFVGSWTRFYCDCSFVPIATNDKMCQAIFPEDG